MSVRPTLSGASVAPIKATTFGLNICSRLDLRASAIARKELIVCGAALICLEPTGEAPAPLLRCCPKVIENWLGRAAKRRNGETAKGRAPPAHDQSKIAKRKANAVDQIRDDGAPLHERQRDSAGFGPTSEPQCPNQHFIINLSFVARRALALPPSRPLALSPFRRFAVSPFHSSDAWLDRQG
jgi:hypothetical protein